MLKKLMKSLAGEFLNVLIDRKIIDFIAGELMREVVHAMEIKVFDVTKTEIAKFELKPGDKIILRYNGVLSDHDIAQIFHSMKPVFPDNQIIVLEQGMELQVVKE